MGYIIQNIYKKKYLTKIIISTILLVIYNYYNQYCSLANTQNHHIKKNSISNNINKKTSHNTKIKIQSNRSQFNLTEQNAYFSGNVLVTHYNNTIYTDEMFLYKKIKDNTTTHTILSGIGNIYFINNIFQLSSKKISTNIQTTNTDLYQNNFYILKKKIYGTSYCIKERENNHFAILKNAHLTTCPPCKKYWKITGLQILYDHKKETLDIWNTYFTIGKIPIFYIPYLQIPLINTKNIKYYPPTPQYNKYDTEIKLPYYFNINKNYHGKIITNFIPKKGIKLQNHIQYHKKLNKNIIDFNILNNQKLKNNKNYWSLHLKNSNILYKKWHIDSTYSKTNNHNPYDLTLKHIHPDNNYYIKKKISCRYTNNIWNINFLYEKIQPLNDYIQNIYNIKPQLNIKYHIYKSKILDYHLFSQITQFKNTKYNYPEAIRLHIEPTINISSNLLNTNLNTQIKLQNTHYQQKNINHYNNTRSINSYNHINTKHSINRCIPQFKNHAKIILNKIKISNKYQQILEPQIQYLYIPYRDQKNITLYDTTIFQIDHTNLFNDKLYSGLDRIASSNQLTSSINTKVYKKNNIELFNISLGQTYFFTPQKTEDYIQKTNIKKNNINNITWATHSYWYITKSLRINTNFQYNTQIKKLKSGNSIMEYHTDNNMILQVNYRYLNSQYFASIIPEQTIIPIYQKNIEQIGIIGNWPINNIFTLSSSQFLNIKNKKNINQTIGIQYRTYCWEINAGYERKINFWNKINTKKYNNKLSINIILYGINNNQQSQTKTCNILHTGTLPYQTIL